MNANANATYTKLRSGDWGVRVEGTAAKGDTITVTKKSGETKQETVRAVVWTGNGVTLCAIAQREAAQGARHGSYRTIGERQAFRQRATGWTGCRCGSIEGRPRDSDCASCQHDY